MKTNLFVRVASAIVLVAALTVAVLPAGASSELPTPTLSAAAQPALADSLRGVDCATLPAGVAAPSACNLNQMQWFWNAQHRFGAAMRLSQTFKVTLQSRLCKIEVRMHKYAPTPPANAVTLSVFTPAGALVDSATIAGGAIPAGPSTQIFNMGCNGLAVNPGVVYRMVLSSPTSPTGAYAWYKQVGNPYPNGQGEANAGAGWVAIGADFAFKVFLCN